MKDTSWQGVAEWYASYSADPTNYHQTIIIPSLLRFLKPQPNQTILDLACGAGVLSTVLAKAGATVIGVDASPTLIAHAKKNTQTLARPPLFKISSASQIPVKDKTIDAIACVLAIQNMNSVKEVMAECARVLVPAGRLIIVLNHPAFRIPRGSSWQWDQSTKQQYRRIDHYMSETMVDIVAHPGQTESETTVSFHRPIQYYVTGLVSAGFAITAIEELISPKKSQSGPRQKEEDRMRKEIPLFMVIEATVR